MRAIPIPTPKRILELYDHGESTREIAQFSVFCVAAARRVCQQFRERGTLDPQTQLCGRKTLISGIRLEGPCAPWLFEGSMNDEMFLAWVMPALAPALHRSEVAIPDSLATHKIRGVREVIQAAGARLMYLPPYWPDFNPVEPMGSKIKQILRSHAPRTNEQLLPAAKTTFQPVTAADCRGFFFCARYVT